MEHTFWQDKWRQQEIGFHLAEANPLLVRHVGRLGLAPGSRVFLPLCGKTRDIAWLLSQGFAVAGCELVGMAIEQLFDELGVVPQVVPQKKATGALTHYHAHGLDIYVGDIFELTPAQLGPVDAIYDRAALVALPADMRRCYAAHLQALTAQAPQLLVTFEYDQAAQAGPPFSISRDELVQHYAARYHLDCVDSQPVPGGLKGLVPATEQVWVLEAK